MITYSMSGQDRWVVEMLNKKRGGKFLEIGAGHPIKDSNSFLLENVFRWSGFSVDCDIRLYPEWCSANRVLHVADALTLEWMAIAPGMHFDYLSLDIDGEQLEFVEKFPWNWVRFNVMTVEHDSYRFGEERRDKIRRIIGAHGYKIHTKDVIINGVPYEDWWEAE